MKGDRLLENFRGLFLALALLLGALPAAAQSMQSLGIRAGIGFNDTRIGTALVTDAPSSDETSFVVGLVADFHMPSAWSLQGGLLYTRRESTLHLAPAGGLPAITSRYEIDFLEAPITLRYRFSDGNFQPYVLAGPNFGFRLRASSKSDAGGDVLIERAGDQFRRASIALEAGLGLRYRTVGRGALTGDVRYIYGLTDLASSSGDSWKIRELRVLVGYDFRF
jgi:hypothetical protein